MSKNTNPVFEMDESIKRAVKKGYLTVIKDGGYIDVTPLGLVLVANLMVAHPNLVADYEKLSIHDRAIKIVDYIVHVVELTD
jgi:hypothetical protein